MKTLDVACDVNGCRDSALSVGDLASHLINDHDSRPGTALIHARRLFGLETNPPVVMVLAPHSPPHISPPHSPRAPRARIRCSGCGTHGRRSDFCPTCHPERAGPVKKSNHRANPAACTFCARLAPEKCSRHGGPSHSSAFRGNRNSPAYQAWREKQRPKERLAKQQYRSRT